MSRITEMILDPQVTYTGKTFTVRVKVQDDYKYKKYLISENIKYVTATGESFTLTNVNGTQPGSILEITGKSIQNGTPTPDAPVEIQSVSGDQNINVMNKNIIQMKEGNYSYSNNSYTIEGTKVTFTATDMTYQGGAVNLYNGTTGRWAGTGLQNNPLTEYGKQYTITVKRSGTINYNNTSGSVGFITIYLYIYDKEGTQTRTSFNIDKTGTTTIYRTNLTADQRIGDIIFYSQFVQCSNAELQFQLEPGNQSTNLVEHAGNSYQVDLGGDNLIQNNMTNQTLNGLTFTINTDKSIKVKGTATARTEPNLWTNANWTMKAGTNYYNNSNTTIYLYGSYNGTNGYFIFNAGATYNREYDYVVQRVYIRVENGTTVDTTYYPYISLKKSNNYSPYTENPIKLCGIDGYENIIRKSTGKNLFDKSKETNQIISGGVISNNAAWRLSDYIEVEEGKKYTVAWNGDNNYFQARVSYFDENKTYKSEQNFNNYPTNPKTNTFTIPEGTKFIRFNYAILINNATVIREAIQIEKGETPTDPEPFGVGIWFISIGTRRTKLVIADMNNSDAYPGWKNVPHLRGDVGGNLNSNINSTWITTKWKSNIVTPNAAGGKIGINTNSTNSTLFLYSNTFGKTQTQWIENYPNLIFELEYALSRNDIIEITNEELIEQLNQIQNMQMQDGGTNIYWTGEITPTMLLQYANNEELHANIITENGKKIRTDWRSIGRRNKWKTKSK